MALGSLKRLQNQRLKTRFVLHLPPVPPFTPLLVADRFSNLRIVNIDPILSNKLIRVSFKLGPGAREGLATGGGGGEVRSRSASDRVTINGSLCRNTQYVTKSRIIVALYISKESIKYLNICMAPNNSKSWQFIREDYFSLKVSGWGPNNCDVVFFNKSRSMMSSILYMF